MVVGFTLIPLGVALGLGALFALLCTLSYGWPPLLSYLLAGCALLVLVAASLVLAEQSR
jgi:hypothetical protein